MLIQPKQIPAYKDTRINNPYTTADQQQVNRQYQTEKNIKSGIMNPLAPTLFEFKINDQIFKQPPDIKKPIDDNVKSLIDQGIYPSPYVPVQNPYMPMGGPFQWMYGVREQLPIIKKYNISISNANGDLVKMHNIFEDALPQVNGIVQKTLTTIAERSIILQYLRSIFVKHTDGEDISIGDKPSNGDQRSELTNLLSHIKLMDINPYHFSRITNNPYKTIPDNFLMFRSCYPVRVDQYNNSVQCALDNIGVNIRIYQMRVMDINANKLGDHLSKKDCDLWREIAYYEFIREQIIKQKVCPNFVMIYSWYITLKSGVDFGKLKKLKHDKSTNVLANDNNLAIQNRMLKEDLMSTIIEFGPMNNKNQTQTMNLNPNSLQVYKLNVNLPKSIVSTSVVLKDTDLQNIDVSLPTNKCIVSITEAPHNNLFDWSTRAYNVDLGPIKKMIQTGYHDLKVWQSVIFQLLAGMYTMYINNIAFNEMSIENNVFIKDLAKDENNIGYWKYKVCGIDYYIPNYGYLVLIDSKYNEISGGIENVELKYPLTVKYKHKIYGKIFDDDVLPPSAPVNALNYVDIMNIENMKRIFNYNNFSQGFTQFGGIKPPSEILSIINNINHHLNSGTSFRDIFILTQSHFLHNRLGNIVKDVEKDQLVKDNFNFKPGDIIAHQFTGSDDSYTWALYLGITKIDNTDDNGHEILTVDHKTLPDNKVPKLVKMVTALGDGFYRSYGQIEQYYKANQKLSEDDILETYIISSK